MTHPDLGFCGDGAPCATSLACDQVHGECVDVGCATPKAANLSPSSGQDLLAMVNEAKPDGDTSYLRNDMLVGPRIAFEHGPPPSLAPNGRQEFAIRHQ